MENRAKIFGEMIFDDKLTVLGLEAETDQEAIKLLSGVLLEQGLVKDSFTHAIQEREKVYATGLELLDMGIAIPHTDAEHVNQPAMAMGILKKPVIFCGMGEPDKKIPVQVMFMLAIREPHAQLQVLQGLLKVFQEEGKLTALYNCATPAEAAAMLTALLNRH